MSELLEACKMNRLPRISVLCDYGLDGRNGVNPLELFDLYKRAIFNGVSGEELEQAMMNDNLEKIVGLSIQSGWGRSFPSDA